MRTRDIMTSPVVTVAPDAILKDVAALLVERGINAVPVVDAGDRLCGIVSEADLLTLETPARGGDGLPAGDRCPRIAPKTGGRLDGPVLPVSMADSPVPVLVPVPRRSRDDPVTIG